MALSMTPKGDISGTNNRQWPRGTCKLGPPLRCLFVEDERAFLFFILSEALREEGFEVLTVTNGADALTLYRANTDRVV